MAADQTVEYYNQTADQYDELHGHEPEHILALETTLDFVKELSPDSLLDVGCGTGMGLQWYAGMLDGVDLIGVDPSEQLLKVAANKVPRAKFHQGFGEKLPLADDSVDIAVATGILHHVDDPKATISEMFRVARKAVVISDNNNYAFSGVSFRRVRLLLFSLGLLNAATFVKQGFRRRGYSDEVGWWYPYSLSNDFDVIAKKSKKFFIFPTRRPNTEAYGLLILSHSHIGVIAWL